MKFVVCKTCNYFENDGDGIFQCDCPPEKKEKHWIDRVIEAIEKDKEKEL